MQRVAYPDTQLRPFIRRFDDIVDAFEEETGYFLKRLGDGFMCVVEVHGKKPARAKFLNNLWAVAEKINSLVSNHPSPRPGQFRFRVVCGYVWKILRANKRKDYLGYQVNLCERLLRSNKSDLFVCSEAFKEMMTEKEIVDNKYTFEKLKSFEEPPTGVYREDFNSLWTFSKGDK